MMVEEQTATRVERSDGGHILIGKREIEDVDILSHTFDMRGFWNDDDASLNQPTQSDLRHAFAVLATDFCKHRKPLRPSANGAHDMMRVPNSSMMCCGSIC